MLVPPNAIIEAPASAGSVQPRIGRRDDRADGLLVEALVALAPLEVFQVAADRPFAEELLVLLGVDPAPAQARGRRDASRPASARRR